MLAESSAAGTPDRLRLRLLEPREEGVGVYLREHSDFLRAILGILGIRSHSLECRFRGLESLVAHFTPVALQIISAGMRKRMMLMFLPLAAELAAE